MRTGITYATPHPTPNRVNQAYLCAPRMDADRRPALSPPIYRQFAVVLLCAVPCGRPSCPTGRSCSSSRPCARP
eukprot:364418-Chlamydomonas_euryale.AAC.6